LISLQIRESTQIKGRSKREKEFEAQLEEASVLAVRKRDVVGGMVNLKVENVWTELVNLPDPF